MSGESVPIRKPEIPYNGPVPGGLQIGSRLQIDGKVLPYGHDGSFAINLCCGPHQDHALHFNPRFGSNKTVLNSRRNGYWEKEEYCSNTFKHGEFFRLEITVKDRGYEISKDNQHLTRFGHRLPFHQVTHLAINGDLEIELIRFQPPSGTRTSANSGAAGFSHLRHSGPVEFAPEPGLHLQPHVPGGFLTMPYSKSLGGGMWTNRRILISGIVQPESHRFAINLHAGNDIALHFNPRFDENVVVRNTQRNGGWENEERNGGQPFARGQQFFLEIRSAPHAYLVAVNGQHFVEFRHRIPAQQVTTTRIEGNVNLYNVDVQ